MSDCSTPNLHQVLTAGNATKGHDIIISPGDKITGTNLSFKSCDELTLEGEAIIMVADQLSAVIKALDLTVDSRLVIAASDFQIRIAVLDTTSTNANLSVNGILNVEVGDHNYTNAQTFTHINMGLHSHQVYMDYCQDLQQDYHQTVVMDRTLYVNGNDIITAEESIVRNVNNRTLNANTSWSAILGSTTEATSSQIALSNTQANVSNPSGSITVSSTSGPQITVASDMVVGSSQSIALLPEILNPANPQVINGVYTVKLTTPTAIYNEFTITEVEVAFTAAGAVPQTVTIFNHSTNYPVKVTGLCIDAEPTLIEKWSGTGPYPELSIYYSTSGYWVQITGNC